MKKFLLISAALILAIFVGLQTPYVVRSSEVFCKTSSPLPRHCMLIKKTRTNDVSLQPFYSSAAPTRFFAFDAYVEGARLSSNFNLYRYIGASDIKSKTESKYKNRNYNNNYENIDRNCISEKYKYDLKVITGKKTSSCIDFNRRTGLTFFSSIDKSADLNCRYKRMNEPASGFQHNCRYYGIYSNWSWSISIRSTQLAWWQEIVSAAKQHLDDNFEHIHHPIIVIPLI